MITFVMVGNTKDVKSHYTVACVIWLFLCYTNENICLHAGVMAAPPQMDTVVSIGITLFDNY